MSNNLPPNRDDRVLPGRGFLLRWCQEFAGGAGNVDFFRHWASAAAHLPVFRESSLALSAKAGFLRPTAEAREALAGGRGGSSKVGIEPINRLVDL